jgi:hypothetical protein
MGLNVNKGNEFVQIEPGTYIAICYRLIDLGTQHSVFHDKKSGKEIQQARKQIMISWEFPTELIESGEAAGKPYSITKFYTASLAKQANLRADLESWRGRQFTEQELEGFDLKKVLGKPCMLNIIEGDKRNIISAITPLPKGFQAPKGVNIPLAFDIDEWNTDVLNQLPEGIQKLICQSDEFKAAMKEEQKTQQGQGEDRPPFNPEDDIPF